ncbi:MAG: AraC family transcriptional regulator [Chitinophagaceae bacterium]
MKVLHTDITHALNSYLVVMENKGRRFSSPLHSHQELELIYIKSGFGKKLLGNTINQFMEGDVVLVGRDLPHKWMCDKSEPSPVSIVAYLNKNVFSEGFYALKESQKLTNLFARAERGLNITGATRQIIGAKMERLTQKSGFKKIIGLMEILHIISTSKEFDYIIHDTSTVQSNDSQTDRLAEVYQYLADNFQKDISLHEISSIANLTEPAFCRLFKKRTGKGFVEYVNEIRISAACKYLQDTDLNVSAIAFRSGFKTISNFNKRFNSITGFSPKEYRRNVQLLQN